MKTSQNPSDSPSSDMNANVPLISLENCRIIRGDATLLSVEKWTLHKGQHWAVLGPNGAGKSTLLQLVRGDILPAQKGVRQYCFENEKGEFEVQNSVLGLRHRIALVSADTQDNYLVNDWKITAREAALAGFYDSLLLYQDPEEWMHVKVEDVFEFLGIAELLERRVATLSTGQCRLMLIARALCVEPDVLILDEFMDGLDLKRRKEIHEAMERAAESATLVCTAHRLEELPSSMTHCAVIEDGQIVQQGKVDDFSYTAQSVILNAKPPVNPTSPDLSVFSVQNVSVVRAGHLALNSVNWEMRGGERWLVLGANGAGKSTFLRLLQGYEYPVTGTYYKEQDGVKPKQGKVERFETPIVCGGTTMNDIRRRIAEISPAFQSLYGVDLEFSLTVRDVALSGLYGTVGVWEDVDPEAEAMVMDLLKGFGLEEMVSRDFHKLSLGQQRRLFFVRAFLSRAEVLLLDEPFSGLDYLTRSSMMKLLANMGKDGQAMVLVTHYPQEALDATGFITHVLHLDNGLVQYSGPVDGFPGVEECF
ncbi:MAG: ABC transporter ATP-binding protein [Desulfovibrio sp.]